MAVKTITVSEGAYEALVALKREGESFSDVIRRLMRKNQSLLEFAGDWKDAPKDKMRRYLEFLEVHRKRLRRMKTGRFVDQRTLERELKRD